MRRLLPNRISSQIAVIIVAGLVTIHAILSAIFFFSRSEERGRPESPAQLATLMRLINRADAADRPRLIDTLDRAFPKFEIRIATPTPAEAARIEHGPAHDPMLHRVDDGVRVAPGGSPEDAPPHRVLVRLKDGQFLDAQMPGPPRPPPPVGFGTATLVSLAVLIAFLALWAARALTAPLRAFAAAAEAFRPDGEISDLPERGPAEIKSAAKALNRLRERIKRLMDDRTRMLAALGHDLRTPITRLRLRSEFIPDENLRRQMTDDLDQMTAMAESVLVLLRHEREKKPAATIDIAADLQTICDRFADLGRDVRYEGPGHAAIVAHADELHRALTNVIDNAVHYGGNAAVRLQSAGGSIVITIDDDGPGIPGDAQKAAMLEPFVRGEAARNMDDATGFGLGLSIALTAAVAHGGTLTLHDREPHGLSVRIVLPAGKAAPGPRTARTSTARTSVATA